MSDQPGNDELTDPLERWLGYRLRRVSAAAMAELAPGLADENFTASLASVLLMIDSNPGQTQAQIGRRLAIKRANIAPMIAKLEDEKLIRKHSINGKSFGLLVTQRGRALTKRLSKVFSAHDDQMFGCLTVAERAQLDGLLQKVWEEAAKA